jgi:protein-disulfide isomerase
MNHRKADGSIGCLAQWFVCSMARIIVLSAGMIVLGCGGATSLQTSQTPPQSGGTSLATGTHVMGSLTAKVTLIEFGDFQCPDAKAFYIDTESQIISTYVNTGEVLFAYRQYPLTSLHQNAEIAAEASECAAQVGGNDAFWAYHNTLFTNGEADGTGLDQTSLEQYAANMQLNSTSFNTCLETHATAAIVSNDIQAGKAAGVTGTPNFFINGKKYAGTNAFSDFQTAIEAALQAQGTD